MNLTATDVSEQKRVFVDDIPDDASVQELLDALVREMQLPGSDVEGRPLVYQALHSEGGRHLRPDERIGDAVPNHSTLVVQPNISAGGM